MFKELFEAISAQATEASRAKAVSIKGEPDHIYAVVSPDGKWDMRHAEPMPRLNKAGSIDAIITLVNDENNEDRSEVWYDRTGVVALLDRLTRRDRVTFKLEYSPQFKRLMDWQSGKDGAQLDQRSLILTLRTMFAANMDRCPSLVGFLRVLRWKNGSETASSIQTGKASIGKQIQGQVTGESNLPETFTLTVPVFAHPSTPWRFDIEIALEPLPDLERFALFPLAGEIEKAVTAAEEKLGESIRDKFDGLVLYGSPE